MHAHAGLNEVQCEHTLWHVACLLVMQLFFFLGPRLGNSPVPSIVQCLARKDGTDDFYQLKVSLLWIPFSFMKCIYWKYKSKQSCDLPRMLEPLTSLCWCSFYGLLFESGANNKTSARQSVYWGYPVSISKEVGAKERGKGKRGR